MLSHDAQETLKWAVHAGLRDAAELMAWIEGAVGVTVTVPIGARWDVIRLSASLGFSALALLRADGHAFGPVLETTYEDHGSQCPKGPGRVDIVVPAGTAEAWPVVDPTLCAAVDSGLWRCPSPSVGPSQRVHGRRWVTAPGGAVPYTDPTALAERVATAMASYRRHRDSSGEPVRWFPSIRDL